MVSIAMMYITITTIAMYIMCLGRKIVNVAIHNIRVIYYTKSGKVFQKLMCSHAAVISFHLYVRGVAMVALRRKTSVGQRFTRRVSSSSSSHPHPIYIISSSSRKSPPPFLLAIARLFSGISITYRSGFRASVYIRV